MQYRFEEFQFLSDIFPTTVNPQNTIIVGSWKIFILRMAEHYWSNEFLNEFVIHEYAMDEKVVR